MKNQCFFTPEIDSDEHAALRAVYDGSAEPHQQRLALHVIVNKFSRAQDVLFVPGAPDEGAFLSGRGFVGQKILKYLNLPVGQLKQEETSDGN
jgi:hypothetical protein